MADGAGVVVEKFFHASYKVRDSPELFLDAALGRLTEQLEEAIISSRPIAQGTDDEEISVSAWVHGGAGTIRQGIVRRLVVRMALRDGLHVYGEPAPEGMVPVKISVSGPPGFVVHDPILPPTETLRLESLDLELSVWSGQVDFLVPFHATGELASEVRPLDSPSATIEIDLRYQACDDHACLLPRSEKIPLEIPLDVIDIPKIGIHTGHGQREAAYDGSPHLRRLMLRKVRAHPLGFLRFILKSIRLECAALWRRLR